MSDYVIGIDPGKKGGIGLIALNGELEDYWPMPDLPANLFRYLCKKYRILRAYVEKSQAMPGQGVVSMFTYGVGFGRILGSLDGLISYDLVSPQTWQRRILSRYDGKDTKKCALIKVNQLYPDKSFILPGCRKPHDGIIDAVLIAEYGRQLHVIKAA